MCPAAMNYFEQNAQHRASDAEVAEDFTERPWGVRQYVVREPNGYLLK